MSVERILTHADFSGRVGEACEIHVGDDRFPLTLDEVQEVPGSRRDGGGFRLEFGGPAEPILVQGIYLFLFGEESFDLFIVPLGRDRRGARYEALFY